MWNHSQYPKKTPMEPDNLNIFYYCLLAFCTLFAGCLGSFSNVVIYRVPKHMSIAWPPSTCPKCGSRIKPYDNIPVLSWLILRGKCRKCKNPISIQYPIIEFICAVFGFFLCRQIFEPNLNHLLQDGVFWRLFVLFAGQLIFLVGCLALAVIDYQTTEIPPEVALPIAALGIVVAFVLPETWPYMMVLGNIEWKDAILGALIGGGMIAAIIGLYYLATKRIGMGGGDIWMMIMVGAFLGWQSLIFVLLAASLQGIIIALAAIALGKKTQQTETQQGLFRNQVADEVQAEVDKNKETESTGDSANTDKDYEDVSTGKLAVPFGPFIALAAIEYVFFGKYLLPLMTGGTLTPWGLM